MILLALGANLPSPYGTPAETLRAALAKLKTLDVVPTKTSHFFVTAAWPNPADPPFVNSVAGIETGLDPPALLKALHHVEGLFGRLRGEPNAPRSLDLDLLDYEGRVEPGPPCLPHPRMDGRGFVLIPLAEVAPQWRHPVLGLSVAELVARLPSDQRDVRILG